MAIWAASVWADDVWADGVWVDDVPGESGAAANSSVWGHLPMRNRILVKPIDIYAGSTIVEAGQTKDDS